MKKHKKQLASKRSKKNASFAAKYIKPGIKTVLQLIFTELIKILIQVLLKGFSE